MPRPSLTCVATLGDEAARLHTAQWRQQSSPKLEAIAEGQAQGSFGTPVGRAMIERLLFDLERRHHESLAQIQALADSILVEPRCSYFQMEEEDLVSDGPSKTGLSLSRGDGQDPFPQKPTNVEVQSSDVVFSANRDGAGSVGTGSLQTVPESSPSWEQEETKKKMQSYKAHSAYSVFMAVPESQPLYLPSIRDVGLRQWLKNIARLIVSNQFFDYALGLIILANAMCLGLQSQLEFEGRPSEAIANLEHVFLAIYTFELILRYYGIGPQCLRDNWVRFDIALIVLGMVALWIVEPVAKSSGGGQNFLSQLLVLRIMRLLRLIRALRMVPLFSTSWRLASGILNSSKTIFSVILLLGFALYVFALVGMDLIARNEFLREDDFTQEIIETNFGSIQRVMLTLVQFVFADSVASIYMPLVVARPALIFYFLPIMLIVSISLMNLTTAVIVEEALDSAHRDREANRMQIKKMIKSMAPLFKKTFLDMDKDKTGTITREEVAAIRVEDLPEQVVEHISPESMEELAEILDADHSGTVTEDEFITGLIDICISEVSKEQLLTLKLVKTQHYTLQEQNVVLSRIQEQLRAVLDGTGPPTSQGRVLR